MTSETAPADHRYAVPRLRRSRGAAYPRDRPRPTRPFTRRGHQADEGKRRSDPGAGRVRALAGLLVATALLYLWGLGASGWANSFYVAAAQAGSASWKAFLFGSSDAANSITVDKARLSIWPMPLSVRLFGTSSWSILVPHALGVGAVWLLPATVRRTTGSAVAGVIAGAVRALTPVAVLMFRRWTASPSTT